MWSCVVVVGLLLDPLHALFVCLEPSIFEKRKVLENVVACVFLDPRSCGISERRRGIGRAGETRETSNNTTG